MPLPLAALASAIPSLFSSQKTTVNSVNTSDTQALVNPSITVSLGGGSINSKPYGAQDLNAPVNASANGGADDAPYGSSGALYTGAVEPPKTDLLSGLKTPLLIGGAVLIGVAAWQRYA